MRTYSSIGLAVGELLLPRADVDAAKWAVVACDQYTSEPEYWAQVADLVGASPSTLKLIYPECFLSESNPDERIARIQGHMRDYLSSGVLEAHDGMVFVERTIGAHTRRGLLACLDLDRYDFTKGSTSLVRATEGTIVDRIPPRLRVRRGAPLELPHILVLLDDPDDTVLGPVAKQTNALKRLYDFDLMKGGGHLRGHLIADRAMEQRVVAAIEALATPDAFAKRYGLTPETPVLLYAVGDGNHSLATAKSSWTEVAKSGAPADSPAKWALVELVNLHDPSLVFEPIHRVLFDVDSSRDLLGELGRAHSLTVAKAPSLEAMRQAVTTAPKGVHRIGVVDSSGYRTVDITSPSANLAVGTLQQFLDPFVASKGAKEIDYVHGSGTVDTLGKKPGNMGFFLPAMSKLELYRTVILDGALPRKTFSMGEAAEKRFYMECRKIS